MELPDFLKPKEYKQGKRAGEEGKGIMDNPYKDEATLHNIKNGMGASPWWITTYKPFIYWQQGWFDGRKPIVDAYFDKHYKNEDD